MKYQLVIGLVSAFLTAWGNQTLGDHIDKGLRPTRPEVEHCPLPLKPLLQEVHKKCGVPISKKIKQILVLLNPGKQPLQLLSEENMSCLMSVLGHYESISAQGSRKPLQEIEDAVRNLSKAVSPQFMKKIFNDLGSNEIGTRGVARKLLDQLIDTEKDKTCAALAKFQSNDAEVVSKIALARKRCNFATGSDNHWNYARLRRIATKPRHWRDLMKLPPFKEKIRIVVEGNEPESPQCVAKLWGHIKKKQAINPDVVVNPLACKKFDHRTMSQIFSLGTYHFRFGDRLIDDTLIDDSDGWYFRNVKNEERFCFKYLSKLQHLDISHSPFLSDFSFIPHLKNLESMRIASPHFDSIELLKDLPKIERVILYDTSIISLKGLEKAKNLTMLHIIDNKFFIQSLRPLRNLKKLDELGLNGSKLRYWSDLSKLPQLKLLDLGNTNFTDYNLLDKLRKLESLSLVGMNHLDLGKIAKLNNLRSLILEDSTLQKNTFGSRITTLRSFKKLTNLNLNGTNVTDLSPLFSLPELVFIRINKTKVSDPEEILQIRALRWVDAYETPITNDEIDYIEEQLARRLKDK